MLNSAVRIDAVVLAQDMRRNSSQLAAASARLAAVDRSPWGIAELFLNERNAA